MSLDITNYDILDNSPITERKYNLLASENAPPPPRRTALAPVKTTFSNVGIIPRTLPPSENTTQTSYIPRPVAPPVTPVISQATPVQQVFSQGAIQQVASQSAIQQGDNKAPFQTKPLVDSEVKEEENVKEETKKVSEKLPEQIEKKSMNWLIGIAIGSVAGYFFAKNQGKNLLNTVLLGAGMGGGIGYLIDNKKNKSINTTNTEVKDQTKQAQEQPSKNQQK